MEYTVPIVVTAAIGASVLMFNKARSAPTASATKSEAKTVPATVVQQKALQPTTVTPKVSDMQSKPVPKQHNVKLIQTLKQPNVQPKPALKPPSVQPKPMLKQPNEQPKPALKQPNVKPKQPNVKPKQPNVKPKQPNVKPKQPNVKATPLLKPISPPPLPKPLSPPPLLKPISPPPLLKPISPPPLLKPISPPPLLKPISPTPLLKPISPPPLLKPLSPPPLPKPLSPPPLLKPISPTPLPKPTLPFMQINASLLKSMQNPAKTIPKTDNWQQIKPGTISQDLSNRFRGKKMLISNVPGDGSCQYHAIGLALNLPPLERVNILKGVIADYLKKCTVDEYERMLMATTFNYEEHSMHYSHWNPKPDDKAMTRDLFILNLLDPRTWGDDATLSILCRQLNFDAYVVEHNHIKPVENDDVICSPHYIILWRGNMHYNTIGQASGSSSVQVVFDPVEENLILGKIRECVGM